MDLLNHVIAVISSLSAPQSVAIAAMVLEFVLRLAKTDKPLSLLLLVALVLHRVAQVAELAASLLDKIVPQRVVAPVDAPKVG